LAKKKEKIGLWMVGVCGGVGCTVALGMAALARRRAYPAGLVTALPPFESVGLCDCDSMVVGGHEIRGETLVEAVQHIHRCAHLFDASLIKALTPDLHRFQRNIRRGTLYGAGAMVRQLADRDDVPKDRSPAAAIERLSADIKGFQQRNGLDCVVVVHLASCEPPASSRPAHANFAHLQRELARSGSRVLPTSSLYALAAIEAGCAFINFTPSLGVSVPAIRARAEQIGVPYMGRDGKTGETLVKSALAPMFAMRHLPILSWVGENILGNRDGAILNDPKTKLSKIRSKDRIIAAITGGKPTTLVSIDYVPSLHDWKVAWDFIHFEGFLGTKMSMQFTWQGSDSVLAAPLVIDLARLAALECRAGRAGAMRHLAFFFKDPMDVQEHDLATQWHRLVDHVAAGSPRMAAARKREKSRGFTH